MSPVTVAGVSTIGDYALWDKNPLRMRGDSVYGAVHARGRPLGLRRRAAAVRGGRRRRPPVDRRHHVRHAARPSTVDDRGQDLLTNSLGYPPDVADGYTLRRARPTPARRRPASRCATPPPSSARHAVPAVMFVWDFIALDDDPTSRLRRRRRRRSPQIIEDYDAGLGELLAALADKRPARQHQHPLHARPRQGRHAQPGGARHARRAADAADGQLAALVAAQGAAMGLDTRSYALLNEDGDAQIYARVDGAGTAGGAAAQADVTHKLLSLIQSGRHHRARHTRTMTADGALGTRSFHDFRAASPNQADIVVFPKDDWTLNQVDATNTHARPVPGARAVPLRPPRRLLRRRALRPAHHGRAGVQERRAAAAPGRAPRRRADRARGARRREAAR